jgi:hypothetical protein
MFGCLEFIAKYLIQIQYFCASPESSSHFSYFNSAALLHLEELYLLEAAGCLVLSKGENR